MAKTFELEGKDNKPDHKLSIEVGDNYEAYRKPIPDPTPYQNGYITWFNSFGVRDKNGKDADVEYTVTLKKRDSGKKLFYLDANKKPVEIMPQDAGNGKIRFKLSIGDPPTGHFP